MFRLGSVVWLCALLGAKQTAGKTPASKKKKKMEGSSRSVWQHLGGGGEGRSARRRVAAAAAAADSAVHTLLSLPLQLHELK